MKRIAVSLVFLIAASHLAEVRAAPDPVAAVPSPEAPAGMPAVTPVTPGWYERWFAGRLEIGTRYTHYTLQDDQQGTRVDGPNGTRFVNSFLGSITEIEADQDNSPDKFFVQYKVCPYAGMGISYDHVRAVTIDVTPQNDGTLAKNTDGTVDAAGPIFYVLGCFPNRTRVTPYAEIGEVRYGTSFDVDPDWSRGGLRTMEVQDSSGLVLAAGLDIRIWDGLSAGVYYRQVDAEKVAADAYTAYGAAKISKPGDGFPIRNDAYGLTVKYTF
jgi:opacity protein-like surface antigen